jgi:hypothetical protein
MSIVSNFLVFFLTPLGVFFAIFSSKTCDKISLVSAFYFREKRENGCFVCLSFIPYLIYCHKYTLLICEKHKINIVTISCNNYCTLYA